jgi:hypothetical protein
MYSKAALFAVVLSVSSLIPVLGLAGVSGKLMQVASSHSGHFTLERHSLITELREGDFRREQVAQFFCDRIFILEMMESILDL